MKQLLAVIGVLLCLLGCGKQETTVSLEAVSVSDQLVEVSCGQCKLDMDGSGCDLAVRIDGKSYFVDGTGIDDHGDAHAGDGFCSVIRQAKVTGKVENNRFVVKSFELLLLNKE